MVPPDLSRKCKMADGNIPRQTQPPRQLRLAVLPGGPQLPAKPQPRALPSKIPHRTSTANSAWQYSSPDLNSELRPTIFPAVPQPQTQTSQTHNHKHTNHTQIANITTNTTTITNPQPQTHNHNYNHNTQHLHATTKTTTNTQPQTQPQSHNHKHANTTHNHNAQPQTQTQRPQTQLQTHNHNTQPQHATRAHNHNKQPQHSNTSTKAQPQPRNYTNLITCVCGFMRDIFGRRLETLAASRPESKPEVPQAKPKITKLTTVATCSSTRRDNTY